MRLRWSVGAARNEIGNSQSDVVWSLIKNLANVVPFLGVRDAVHADFALCDSDEVAVLRRRSLRPVA